MQFVHLHVHSHYSLLDSLIRPKVLPKLAKSRGQKAVALTDTGAMYGLIEFYQACLNQEIKPILGFETRVAPHKLTDKDPERDKDSSELVLLAENYEGYKNLIQLCSIGAVQGVYMGKARVDKDALQKFHKNIIALSGGIHGEIPKLLLAGKKDEAARVAKDYVALFGADNFFLELQDHPAISGQMQVNTELISLGRELNIPLVVTRDVHYAEPADVEAQDIMVCIREGWKVDQPNREDMRHVDRSLNTGDDIASRFRHVPDAIENTVKIADRINVEIPLNKWHFAPIDLPPGKNADEVLRERAETALGDYYSPVTDEVRTRLEYELGIIQTKGYSPYFICVSDFVHYAKTHGIVETTRGSAAGSLVSYVLGITTVDPIRFKLPFERFLNPYRPSPPDIDTDFADDRRDDMIAYVTKKYGADKVAQIITFGTMAARASVRDVGRALGMSYSFCDQVAKLIPMGAQGFPMTIERALNEEPDLKKLYESNPDVKRLLNLAKTVEGSVRHTSIHAAGVVISPTTLTDFTPIQHEVGGTRITTQYEMKSVETAGLLKMDFLGIRNLSILGKAVEFVEKTTGEKVDIYELPLDDKETFEMLSRGETMGTFQLGGSGMTRWLKELRPSTIDDIMAMVALYRPGPMDSIPEYIRRKHNPELVHYLDPRMEKYLDKSYGIIVYQDDLLFSALELAGYNWEEVDKFRKAVGKKIPEEMAAQKEKLTKGIIAHGQTKEFADELWKLFEPFQAYGFNKAHAASYGIFAYQTSYMKAHYPVQYMTAVLYAEAGDAEKVAEIVHECHRMGIEVLPPDVNESFRNFAMVSKPGEKGRIRFGLTAIKNVGEHICEIIYTERKENGPYKSLEDLLERVQDKDLNKKSLESLIQTGALDGFGYDRGHLLANTEQLLAFARAAREQKISAQNSLFAGTSFGSDGKIILRNPGVATMEDKLRWEKQLLGLYISSHPFAPYEIHLRRVLTPLSDVEAKPRDGWVIIGGVIASVTKKLTKKGTIMLFVKLEDMSSGMELLVFPKTYEATQAVWQENAIVCVVGKTPKEEGDNKVFVENVYALTPENVVATARQLVLTNPSPIGTIEPEKSVGPSLHITVTAESLKNNATALKSILAAYPGAVSVFIHVGLKTIHAATGVVWSEELGEKIKALVGASNVEYKS